MHLQSWCVSGIAQVALESRFNLACGSSGSLRAKIGVAEMAKLTIDFTAAQPCYRRAGTVEINAKRVSPDFPAVLV